MDDERDVDHAGPGEHVGEVGDPQLVRCGRAEMPPDQVGRPARGRGRRGGGTRHRAPGRLRALTF